MATEETKETTKRPLWQTIVISVFCVVVAAAGIYFGSDELTKSGVEGAATVLIQDEVVTSTDVEKAADCIDIIIGVRSQDSTDIKATLCSLQDVASNTGALGDSLKAALGESSGAQALVTCIIKNVNAKYSPGDGEEKIREVLKLISEALHEAAKNA